MRAIRNMTSAFLPPLPTPTATAPLAISGVANGVDVLLMAQLGRTESAPIIHISVNDAGMAELESGLITMGVAPTRIFRFPAWDCLPFDRVSPSPHLVGQRIKTLAQCAAAPPKNAIILTTINAWLQKVPPPDYFKQGQFALAVGARLSLGDFTAYAEANAYHRTNTVREVGEYAVRGSIIDVFPTGSANPIRLDRFGDDIESIKEFDAETQRSQDSITSITLYPVSELPMDSDSISRFRQHYIAHFGGQASRDALYQMTSNGTRVGGAEHYLPLFHENLVHFSAYVQDPLLVLAHEWQSAYSARMEQMHDFYEARLARMDDEDSIRPLPIDALYLDAKGFEGGLQNFRRITFSTFNQEISNNAEQIELKTKKGFLFHQNKVKHGGDSIAHLRMMLGNFPPQQAILIAAASAGGRERIATRLAEHDLNRPIHLMQNWDDIKPDSINIFIWVLASGFILPNLAVITEQDIYGTRLTRPQRKRKRAEHFLQEVSSLSNGDLVVHSEHGIGRYDGLETLTVANAAHDCLLLTYAGGDRLYLPVENIDLLSRYGQSHDEPVLDRLGGVAWQAKKARVKKRIRDIAGALIKTAAMRQTASTGDYEIDPASYGEFCQGFTYAETDDQLDAINDTLGDMRSGRAMDRLICGDVGFGKTEVALRAAFVAVMAGYQVAVVAPTTLLARQHGKLFTERFRGFGVSIGVLSRMTKAGEASRIKKQLASGDCQLVIGTHALLSKAIKFNHLGLMIVDEEQHFGVSQKERLKSLRGDIHVLTLTATPIPRTLQMALSGVRDMSIIATPPIDRLAIRTSVGAWDHVVLAEAIRRERHRGGQIFCVSPRIDYLGRVYDRLLEMAGDARILTAHGQMPPAELDAVMNRFGDGEAEILLATNIIESGIDIPSANTMIIHRADLFGLAQLYQLRGRIGRGAVRAYAYLTTESGRKLTPSAQQRLEVMQTLDALGAGFTLASYDLDIRGGGNLLGDEQSGHIREVGVELYQSMLDEAVREAKTGTDANPDGDWAPNINLGASVLIPESYVADLAVRLSLYRRIGAMENLEEQDQLIAELTDRFGAIPQEVANLIDTIILKMRCRLAHIEKLDAGPKGISISFRNNQFPQAEKLIAHINEKAGAWQVMGAQKLVIPQTLPQSARATTARAIVEELLVLAGNDSVK